MSGRQDGQALVGALVVTTLAFLMAGTVAVGASALLSQESNSQNASSRDLTVQDALTAAVAGVAGRGTALGPTPCSPSQVITTVLPSGYPSQALCARADRVHSGPPTLLQLPWSGSCAVVDVSAYSNDHVLIWSSARGDVSAWVDDRRSGCRQQPTPLCADSATGSVTQVVLDCDLVESQEENGTGNGNYLHVQSPAQSPVLVRLGQYDNAGGTIYVLAASTGVAGGPTYEEADIWVSPDGATTALCFEGTL